MADPEENEAGDGEQALDDKVDVIDRKSIAQLLIMAGVLPLMLVVFVVGLVSLSNAHKSTSKLLEKKPENRVELFADKITRVEEKAQSQYGKYLSKMEDESIFDVSDKFKKLYQLSLQSEADYVEFLNAYQKLAYESASRVRGSGEWYYYQEKKVVNLVATGERRESRMVKYFGDE